MPRLQKEHFERLVHEHHGAVYRAALRVADDAAGAADVAQEVFVRVLEGKEHLDAARNDRAALCWLAARLAANARRSRRRRQDHEENAMRQRENPSEPSDPADLSADADLRRAVHAQVQALPHELRVPLLMRCEDDLTLAAIGSALRVPVSTVHDRIESALQRVRTGLGGRGRAMSLAALPQLIGTVDAPAVPLDLEARLLSLGSRVVPVVAGAGRRVLVAVLALAGAAGIVFAANVLQHGASPSVVASAPIETPQDPQRPPLPPPPPLPERERAADGTPPAGKAEAPRVLGTLTGTVRDAEAWPVGGATVQAVAGGGYKPFAVGEPAKTDARGAFTVEVKPTFLTPSKVRLVVRENGRELLMTPDLELPLADGAGPLELVLPASVGSATARYECTVAVRDENGAALAGVEVRFCDPDETRAGWGSPEATAKSGADGNAVLAGRGLGRKRLFVDGRPLGRRSVYGPYDVKTPGQHTATVTLAPGGELLADVKALDGQPLEWCNAWLEDERTGLQHTSEATPDGTLRFRALGDGPFTLRVHGSHKSPARRAGLRANGETVRMRLKANDDVRDVGDHMAELRGGVFDAATGERLSFGPFDVDVMPAFAGESSLVFDRVEPPGPAQRSAEGGTFHEFHKLGLEPGRCAIHVSLPGYAKTAVEFDLREDQIVNDVRIELQRPATVRGRVVDAAGQPVPGAIVFVVGTGSLADAHLEAWRPFVREDEDPMRRSPSFTPLAARAGKDGTFAIGQLPPGIALRLCARDDTRGFGVRPLPVLRAGDKVDNQDVRLEPR